MILAGEPSLICEGLALPLNERQAKLINRLLDGFDGKLTTGKWAAIAKCSPDTALRDIADLVARVEAAAEDVGERGALSCLISSRHCVSSGRKR